MEGVVYWDQPWGEFSFLMGTNGFSNVFQLVPHQELGNAYQGCSMHIQHILLLIYCTIFEACDLFLLGLVL